MSNFSGKIFGGVEVSLLVCVVLCLVYVGRRSGFQGVVSVGGYAHIQLLEVWVSPGMRNGSHWVLPFVVGSFSMSSGVEDPVSSEGECFWARPELSFPKRPAAYGNHFFMDSPNGNVHLSEDLCSSFGNTGAFPMVQDGRLVCALDSTLFLDVSLNDTYLNRDLGKLKCAPRPHCCDQLGERNVYLSQSPQEALSVNLATNLLEMSSDASLFSLQPYWQNSVVYYMLMNGTDGFTARVSPHDNITVIFEAYDGLNQKLATNDPLNTIRFQLTKQPQSTSKANECPLHVTTVEKLDMSTTNPPKPIWNSVGSLTPNLASNNWIARCDTLQ